MIHQQVHISEVISACVKSVKLLFKMLAAGEVVLKYRYLLIKATINALSTGRANLRYRSYHYYEESAALVRHIS